MTETSDIHTSSSLRNLTAKLPSLSLGRLKRGNADEAGGQQGGDASPKLLGGTRWSHMLHGIDSGATPVARRRQAREQAAAADPEAGANEPNSPGLRTSIGGDSQPTLFT
eukprot:4926842-Amphidinium_carterae.1